MAEFRMPSLGADMEAGTLVEWLVKPGDMVKRGDIVAVVETQKGAIEIETFQAGEIERLLVATDTKVPVGTPLAWIRGEGETPAGPAQAAPSTAPVAPPPTAIRDAVAPAVPVASRAVAVEPTMAMRASPAARQLALKSKIDLAAIAGSGPGGAITVADVERHLAAGAAAAPAAALAPSPAEKKRPQWLDLDAMRVAIAAAMARSKREIPHYYLEHHVDVGGAERWLIQANATRPPESRLLFTALAIKAVALAARRFPAFNGFYRDQAFQPAEAVHVGVAIAIRGGGLAAPALHDADRQSLDDVMTGLRDLVQRTRAGRMRSSELTDATITVSSLGERGVEVLYGVIYPPQVAIVGVGKSAMRPWIVEGAVASRPVVTITLSADHRASDGHAGALFLVEVGKLLQEPEKL